MNIQMIHLCTKESLLIFQLRSYCKDVKFRESTIMESTKGADVIHVLKFLISTPQFRGATSTFLTSSQGTGE
jgi:hypothetical protein